jgi:uncharacterized BrkB/YihY/UPF0761 family membrane protein
MAKELTKKISTEKKRLATEHEAFLEDMFNDIYSKRRRIYGVNFVRGLFFGLGTFLGGTVVVALLVWILSRFIDWPFIEKIVEALQR